MESTLQIVMQQPAECSEPTQANTSCWVHIHKPEKDKNALLCTPHPE
jgi:hypothetical protein